MTNALWLDGWETLEMKIVGDARECVAQCSARLETCPKCGVVGRLYRHGTKTVEYRDAPAFGKQVVVVAKVVRYRCRDCNQTSMQPVTGMDERRRMTKRCVEYIEQQGVPQTYAALARHIGVDEKTVRNICNEAMARRMTELKVDAPVILGIDELTLLGRKRTIFVDIGARKPLDIIDSMDRRRVERWLWKLPRRENIKIVAIDMWGPYKNASRLLLPGAKVVVDKWHVMSKVNFALDRVRNRVRHAGKNPRRNPRQGKLLLQTSRHRLSPMRRMLLDGMLANSPLLSAAWHAKEAFYDIFATKKRAVAEKRFDAWVAGLDPQITAEFQPVANMVQNWRAEIFAFFDYPVTNAYTEAVNGLTKIANRAGRGYSFETIRAKALLREPGRLCQCPYCKGEFPASSFRTPVVHLPPDEQGNTSILEGLDAGCINCHFRFHTLEWIPAEVHDDALDELADRLFSDQSTPSHKFLEKRCEP